MVLGGGESSADRLGGHGVSPGEILPDSGDLDGVERAAAGEVVHHRPEPEAAAGLVLADVADRSPCRCAAASIGPRSLGLSAASRWGWPARALRTACELGLAGAAHVEARRDRVEDRRPGGSAAARAAAPASTARSCAATGSAGSGVGSRLKESWAPKTGVGGPPGHRHDLPRLLEQLLEARLRPRIEAGWIRVATASSGPGRAAAWRRWASSTTPGCGESSTRWPRAASVLTPATTGWPSSAVASRERRTAVVSGRQLGEDRPVVRHRAAEEGDGDPLQLLRLVAGHQGGGAGDLGQGADLVLAGAQQADVLPAGGRIQGLPQLLAEEVHGMQDGDGGHGGSFEGRRCVSGRGPRRGRRRAIAAAAGPESV